MLRVPQWWPYVLPPNGKARIEGLESSIVAHGDLSMWWFSRVGVDPGSRGPSELTTCLTSLWTWGLSCSVRLHSRGYPSGCSSPV